MFNFKNKYTLNWVSFSLFCTHVHRAGTGIMMLERNVVEIWYKLYCVVLAKIHYNTL